MSIELIKDVLRIEELRGKEEIQALVETEIYLSQSNPDIEKILWTDGLVEILTTKVMENRLIISGVVKFKTIYRSEEKDNIYIVDGNKDFKEEIEIMGIREEMSAIVKSNIEYIEDDIVDERKLSLKALVSIAIKVEEVNTIEIIKDIEERKNLEVLKETIKYKEIYGRETSYAIIKDGMEIEENSPSVEEVLKLTLEAFEQEATVVENRVIVSGKVMAKIIYYGEGKIFAAEKELPFNHFLDIPGVPAESCAELIIEVAEGGYEVLEDENGDLKLLDIEGKLRISATAYEENEKNLVVDAYSTEEEILIEKEEISLIENIENINHSEEVFKEIYDEDIDGIYSLEGHPILIDSRFVDEELVIEGVVGLQIIYLEKSTSEISTLRDEIPYKVQIPIEDKQIRKQIDVDMNLVSIDPNISSEGLSIKAVVAHKININRNRELNVIKEISETGELIDKKNRPSITIYIVQKNDSLWNIAKRYNTTLEEIQAANENINPDNIIAGEKIIIEKKVDINF